MSGLHTVEYKCILCYGDVSVYSDYLHTPIPLSSKGFNPHFFHIECWEIYIKAGHCFYCSTPVCVLPTNFHIDEASGYILNFHQAVLSANQLAIDLFYRGNSNSPELDEMKQLVEEWPIDKFIQAVENNQLESVAGLLKHISFVNRLSAQDRQIIVTSVLKNRRFEMLSLLLRSRLPLTDELLEACLDELYEHNQIEQLNDLINSSYGEQSISMGVLREALRRNHIALLKVLIAFQKDPEVLSKLFYNEICEGAYGEARTLLQEFPELSIDTIERVFLDSVRRFPLMAKYISESNRFKDVSNSVVVFAFTISEVSANSDYKSSDIVALPQFRNAPAPVLGQLVLRDLQKMEQSGGLAEVPISYLETGFLWSFYHKDMAAVACWIRTERFWEISVETLCEALLNIEDSDSYISMIELLEQSGRMDEIPKFVRDRIESVPTLLNRIASIEAPGEDLTTDLEELIARKRLAGALFLNRFRCNNDVSIEIRRFLERYETLPEPYIALLFLEARTEQELIEIMELDLFWKVPQECLGYSLQQMVYAPPQLLKGEGHRPNLIIRLINSGRCGEISEEDFAIARRVAEAAKRPGIGALLAPERIDQKRSIPARFAEIVDDEMMY